MLWEWSSLKRVRKCGRYSHLENGCVQVRQMTLADKTKSEGYAGLVTCGSVWACPCCSARINATRRLEMECAVIGAGVKGYSAMFVTCTLRHRVGQPLADLLDALRQGQRGVAQARAVRRLRQQMGYVGCIRATEVTLGEHGWHPHTHSVYFFDRANVSHEEMRKLGDAEFAVWQRQCAKRGLGAPIRKCYDVRKVRHLSDALDYLSKAPDNEAPADKKARVRRDAEDSGMFDPATDKTDESMGFEMTGGNLKRTHAMGSRTPWEVLASFGETGDVDDLDHWHEYEKATKGKQMLVWSPGLKKLFGVKEEADEEIAKREEGSRIDTVFVVTDWRPVREKPTLAAGLLNALHSGGLSSAQAYCDRHDIPTEPFEL